MILAPFAEEERMIAVLGERALRQPVFSLYSSSPRSSTFMAPSTWA